MECIQYLVMLYFVGGLTRDIFEKSVEYSFDIILTTYLLNLFDLAFDTGQADCGDVLAIILSFDPDFFLDECCNEGCLLNTSFFFIRIGIIYNCLLLDVVSNERTHRWGTNSGTD